MNRVEVLQKDSQKFLPDFSCQKLDFSEFKVKIWIPLLKEKMRSWKLYIRIYTQYLENFINAHSHSLLSGEKLQTFAIHLKEKTQSPGSYNRILSVLKHFLKSSFEHGIIDTDFSSLLTTYFVKPDNKGNICLNAEKIKLLFKKLANSDSCQARAIELLILTGASKSEILTARWEDYDSEKHLLTVKSRNGSKRTLRLGPQSVAILKGMQRQSLWIFPGRDKAKHLNDIFRFWDEIRRECGLDSIRIQDLKHNYKNWQKNNSGYSISIEEQLEIQGEKPIPTPYIDLLIKPEIALIGFACAKYDNEIDYSALYHKVSSHIWNTLLFNYMGNICKARIEALDFHKLKGAILKRESFLIDLAGKTLKNARLSKRELDRARSAIYLGLDNPKEYLINNYRFFLSGEINLYHNLLQSMTLALGFSKNGIEINSPGCSFFSALQTACFKIAFGELDIALVGGTDLCNDYFSKELIPELRDKDNIRMTLICSPAYAERAKIPVISAIPLSALNEICTILHNKAVSTETL